MPKEVIGARWVSLIFGAMVLLTGLVPAIVSREDTINEAHKGVPLLSALKLTFSDRLFLHFIAMIIVSITGVTIASSLGLFITIYYVFGGEKQNAANLMFYSSIAISGFTLVLATLMPKAAKIVGKRGMILCGQVLFVIGGLSAWIFYNPRHPYWLILPSILSTSGLASFQVLYGVIHWRHLR